MAIEAPVTAPTTTPTTTGTTAPTAASASTIDGLVAGGLKALAGYATFTQTDVDRIVKKASVAALNKHGELARLAVEETGRGVFEDKAVKNIFACEHVAHSMAELKTVGIIQRDELHGVVEIAEPVGVICGVTPVTNPTSTAIFKALIALKTRNPIIFTFHPSAQECSVAAAEVVRVPRADELGHLFTDVPMAQTPVKRGDLPPNGDGAPLNEPGPGG